MASCLIKHRDSLTIPSFSLSITNHVGAGIAQWYSAVLLDDRWFKSRQGTGIFLSTAMSRPASGTPNLLSNGYQGLIPSLRGDLPPTPQCVFMPAQLHIFTNHAALPPEKKMYGQFLKSRNDLTELPHRGRSAIAMLC
jgi:hypothetical protein